MKHTRNLFLALILLSCLVACVGGGSSNDAFNNTPIKNNDNTGGGSGGTDNGGNTDLSRSFEYMVKNCSSMTSGSHNICLVVLKYSNTINDKKIISDINVIIPNDFGFINDLTNKIMKINNKDQDSDINVLDFITMFNNRHNITMHPCGK